LAHDNISDNMRQMSSTQQLCVKRRGRQRECAVGLHSWAECQWNGLRVDCG